VLVGVALIASACGGNSTTPSSTPPPAPATRVITVSGDLAFGNVNIGESATRTFTISNSGNAALTFTSLSAVGGTGITGYAANPTSGTVSPGGSITVSLRFSPTAAGFFSHVLTVVGDQTGGGAAINVSGVGINNTPLFTASGIGDAVFDMPTTVARIRVQATPTTSCQNFIVRIGGRASIINVILGTCSVADARSIDSTYLTGGGGVVSITSSTGIQWTFTEIR
jgi:Abnormal spindle-like microcephaly-assoc'd, ASPM-SPD-2-Hydin